MASGRRYHMGRWPQAKALRLIQIVQYRTEKQEWNAHLRISRSLQATARCFGRALPSARFPLWVILAVGVYLHLI